MNAGFVKAVEGLTEVAQSGFNALNQGDLVQVLQDPIHGPQLRKNIEALQKGVDQLKGRKI